MPEARVGLLTETHVHEPFRPKTILRSCGEDSHWLIGYFIVRDQHNLKHFDPFVPYLGRPLHCHIIPVDALRKTLRGGHKDGRAR